MSTFRTSLQLQQTIASRNSPSFIKLYAWRLLTLYVTTVRCLSSLAVLARLPDDDCDMLRAVHIELPYTYAMHRFGIKLPRYNQIVNTLTWMSHSQALKQMSKDYVIDLYMR